MNTKNKWIYVAYFWKYASNEQVEDMMILSIDMIAEYILTIGKEYYILNKDDKKTSLFVKEKLKLEYN